jgi:hypothetical protein
MNMKTPLSITEQDQLRLRHIIKDSEIAYRDGNLYFAEDAISGERRVINVSSMVQESKTILFG